MVTPTSATATNTATSGADPAAAPAPAASHPTPRAYYPSPVRPPLFAGQPLPGRPLTSPSQPHPPQAILHSAAAAAAAAAAHRGFPPRVSANRPDHHLQVPNPVNYIRTAATPTGVMTFPAAAHIRPIVYASASISEKQVPVLRGRSPSPVRPQPMPPPYLVPRPVGAATSSASSAAAAAAAFPAGGAEGGASGPPKSAPATFQPKVSSAPSVSLATEVKNSKEREKSRDNDVVMINDRKVRLPDGGSCSLYSLCRSWVRNGMPHETEPNFGDSERLLPKPLSISSVDSQMLQNGERDAEVEGPLLEESAGSVEELSTHDLLDQHIKRAKRVRARLRKERLLRIERYKQRLSLLLPPPSELGRNDVTSGD